MVQEYHLSPLSPQVVLHEGCNLRTSERLLYVAMIQAVHADTCCVRMSIPKMASATGLTEQTARKARDGLLAAGAIEVAEEAYATTARTYRLTAGHLGDAL